MKIALCWNSPQELAKASVRHDIYVRGFEHLGHEVITICPAESAREFSCEVAPFTNPKDWKRPAFWRSFAPDVLMMVTWLTCFEEFAAARLAGVRTLALADSDGQIGFSSHWQHTFYRSVTQHERFLDKIAATKFAFQRLASRGKEEEKRVIRSIEESDRVIVNTSIARQNLRLFLRDAARNDLADKIVVCPYPVDPMFSASLDPVKENQFVAVGRWDSPQKDGKLLADSLETYYQRGGTAEALILGDGYKVFSNLCKRRQKVRCLGVQEPSTVSQIMATSRSLLLTSRWESGPIVAFEALCKGCTLVSTDIPNLRELIGSGRFGQIALRRTPDSFADVLIREMHAWDNSSRNSATIANYWVPIFRAEAVCQKLLLSIGSEDKRGTDMAQASLNDGSVRTTPGAESLHPVAWSSPRQLR